MAVTRVVMTGPDVGMTKDCLNCTFEMRNVNDSSTDDGIMTGFDANVSGRDATLTATFISDTASLPQMD